MLEDEKDDSSKLIIKTINVLEYDVKEFEDEDEKKKVSEE